MNKQNMIERGEAHGKAGKANTPSELQTLDAELFAITRQMDRLAGAKFYNEMRGAFNAGWQRGYLIAQGMA
jgi:hypothetical protein